MNNMHVHVLCIVYTHKKKINIDRITSAYMVSSESPSAMQVSETFFVTKIMRIKKANILSNGSQKPITNTEASVQLNL